MGRKIIFDQILNINYSGDLNFNGFVVEENGLLERDIWMFAFEYVDETFRNLYFFNGYHKCALKVSPDFQVKVILGDNELIATNIENKHYEEVHKIVLRRELILILKDSLDNFIKTLN